MAVIFILPLKDKTKKELTCLMTGNIRFVMYNDIRQLRGCRFFKYLFLAGVRSTVHSVPVCVVMRGRLQGTWLIQLAACAVVHKQQSEPTGQPALTYQSRVV